MKKIACILLLIATSYGCSKDDSGEKACGTHNGQQLYKGPEGGCYYINSNDNKTYVDRSECNCN